jgi:hypothetical protein
MRRKNVLRKLAFGLVFLLFLGVACDYYFGSNDHIESALPGPKIAPGRLAETPGSAVYHVYNAIAVGAPRGACFLFDDDGAAAFARNFHASSCEEVVNRLHGAVDRDPRAFLRQARGATGQTWISSCAVRLRAGTTSLGLFVLTEPLEGEWIISDHRPEPVPCPPRVSGTSPPAGPTTTPLFTIEPTEKASPSTSRTYGAR